MVTKTGHLPRPSDRADAKPPADAKPAADASGRRGQAAGLVPQPVRVPVLHRRRRPISDKAIVDPGAEIADGRRDRAVLRDRAEREDRRRLRPAQQRHRVRHTTIGRDNIFFPNSVIGTGPAGQEVQGGRDPARDRVGNAFREACTVHVGTEKGGGLTKIGDDNLFMVNSHIGHDAIIGSHCVVANNVMIAGHVIIGDYVIMNGGAGVNQFVSIGDYAYLSGYCRVHHDVPPFCKIDGSDEIRALNKVGMARSGRERRPTSPDVDAAFRRCS
jgi:UDP-N-acetylglucosamine acyltransferase